VKATTKARARVRATGRRGGSVRATKRVRVRVTGRRIIGRIWVPPCRVLGAGSEGWNKLVAPGLARFGGHLGVGGRGLIAGADMGQYSIELLIGTRNGPERAIELMW